MMFFKKNVFAFLLLFVTASLGQDTESPSSQPSIGPSGSPTSAPSTTTSPSISPSGSPTALASISPSHSSTPSGSPSSEPSIAPSSAPSPAPSSQPSAPPTHSAAPSSFPSVQPSLVPSPAPSSGPSPSPTGGPTAVPTMSPTYDPDLPPNDRCERAFDIGVDGPSEGWFNNNSSPGSRCRAPAQIGPSVWYRFEGTGQRLSVLLCDNDDLVDSGINIYRSPTGRCEDNYCGLNSRFTVSPCGTEAAAGTTTLKTQVGTTYYVEVMTFGTLEGTTGLVRVKTA